MGGEAKRELSTDPGSTVCGALGRLVIEVVVLGAHLLSDRETDRERETRDTANL